MPRPKAVEPIRTDTWYPNPVSVEETRRLFINMIHLAIIDLCSRQRSARARHYKQTAYSFLLDPSWEIDWGDRVLSLGDILYYLGIEDDCFKERVLLYYRGDKRMEQVRGGRSETSR